MTLRTSVRMPSPLRPITALARVVAFALPGVLLLAVSPPNRAAEIQTTTERDTSPAASAPYPHDDRTPARFARESWGLSEAEWQRYRHLMRGLRGSISPATLSPLEVLGIHAETDAERLDYARRWARLLRDDATRVLAFQRAYALAFRELDPTGQVLAPARPLPRSETPDLQAGDRLLVFLRLDRCPDCAATLAAAQKAALKTGAQLDLYVVGADSDEALRRWADRQRLDRRALKTGRLTLNHERGELATVAGLAATVPTLVRLRQGTAQVLDRAFVFGNAS
jgi:integrating conjugative element protein (TIGR03759 family)